MNHDQILASLHGIFEEVFGRPVELTDETTAADVEGWDSVAHIMLILASEREFDVRFESSELANVPDVGAFVELVGEKQHSKQLG